MCASAPIAGAELEQTLRSLGGARSAARTATVRVIVADNDIWPSARKLVDALRAELAVRGPLRPLPGVQHLDRPQCLPRQRHAAISSPSSTMIRRPRRRWLAELIETAAATGADAVLGPVRAVYAPSAPGWMRRGDFHSTSRSGSDGEIRTGYSCNVLLRRASPHVRAGASTWRSAGAAARTPNIFRICIKSGGRIAYAPDAVAYEPVTAKSRSDFRGWRSAASAPARPMAGCWRRKQRLAAASRASPRPRPSCCFGAALAFAPVAQLRNRQALRGVMHVGVVSGLLGVREIRLYGDETTRKGGAMQPDVSFVIAAYNAEASIARAIESALAQRTCRVEVVVVDDAPATARWRLRALSATTGCG